MGKNLLPQKVVRQKRLTIADDHDELFEKLEKWRNRSTVG